MPISLPSKAHARVREREPIQAIDWIGVWSVSLGICAAALAAVVYFLGGDKIGATMVLAGAIGIIALFVRVGTGRP